MKKIISSFLTLAVATMLFAEDSYTVKTFRQKIIPANPTGTGVQIDFPFLGYSDTSKDPVLFNELVDAIKKMGIKTLRFPGGCAAYAYSFHRPEPFSAFKPVYYACDEKIGQWSDVDNFLRLCKAAGCQALYQLNIGNYYDPESKMVYAIAPRDSGLRYGAPKEQQKMKLDTPKSANYDYSKLSTAADEAGQIARKAQKAGVKVIWEFGNEDYCFYSPETYIKTVKPFYQAIRAVDPKAEFAICGDGISWGDWRWSQEVLKLAAENKLPVDYASFHIYVSGGGGGKYTDGTASYDGIIKSYKNIRHLHAGMRKHLDSLGYNNTKLAITEGNVSSGKPMLGQPFEHGMGRALGEAANYPDRIRRYAMLIHHDLVRSGPQNGTWYCRIFYEPANKPGERYILPTAATVMGKMTGHASRMIIFDSLTGVAVSQGENDFLFTAGNPTGSAKDVSFKIDFPLTAPQELVTNIICAENMDTPNFKALNGKAFISKADKDQRMIKITLPPYSFTYLTVKK